MDKAPTSTQRIKDLLHLAGFKTKDIAYLLNKGFSYQETNFLKGYFSEKVIKSAEGPLCQIVVGYDKEKEEFSFHSFLSSDDISIIAFSKTFESLHIDIEAMLEVKNLDPAILKPAIIQKEIEHGYYVVSNPSRAP